MRCPKCQTENPSDTLYCDACHLRLFAWLGDPFGNLDLPVVAAQPSRSGGAASTLVSSTTPITGTQEYSRERRHDETPAFPWGKAVVTGLLTVILLSSPVWAVFTAVSLGLAIWRFPRISSCMFAAAAVAVLIVGSVATEVLTETRSRATSSPTLSNPTLQGGTSLWRSGNFEGADQQLTLVVRQGGVNLADALNLRALVRASGGKYNEALDDVNHALELRSNSIILDTRAYIYLKLHRYQDALADYQTIANLAANQPIPLLLGRGLARAGLGEDTEAMADIENGLKLAQFDLLPDPELRDLVAEGQRSLDRLRGKKAP